MVWLTDFYTASQAKMAFQRVRSIFEKDRSKGISNCLTHNEHFHICCTSECEGYLSEIVVASGSPSASADLVIAAVRKLATSLQDS